MSVLKTLGRKLNQIFGAEAESDIYQVSKNETLTVDQEYLTYMRTDDMDKPFATLLTWRVFPDGSTEHTVHNAKGDKIREDTEQYHDIFGSAFFHRVDELGLKLPQKWQGVRQEYEAQQREMRRKVRAGQNIPVKMLVAR